MVTASNERLDRLAGREEMNVGLNPPEETGDRELVELVRRALQAIGLAEGK